jgi:AAA family ATP:ADP antiporter
MTIVRFDGTVASIMGFRVRREDRRNLAVGFAGLMAIMTAHSVMETARDTLFLSSLPAADLPRAYLAIAVLAIAELKIHERVMRRIRDRRTLLAASLVFGSLVTLGFWGLLDERGTWARFGFYVWTGLLITVVLIEFWLLLDEAVTVTQAKRIFPAIAAGGVTGAVLGSLLAEALLRVISPAGLVFVSAIVLVVAAAASLLWGTDQPTDPDTTVSEHSLSIKWLLRDGYLPRLLGLALVGTIALTVVDFVFKSAVAERIPVEGLGPFFARFYLGLNIVTLVVQVIGTGWLLRAFGAHRSSALLPLLIFCGAVGLALGPILPFAVSLKAVDGSLRHTLHRSAFELLFLPLDSRRRERAKGIVEVFGHRVGQAIASLLILGAVGLGLTTRQLGIALSVLVLGWLVMILVTRKRYVDQLRSKLQQDIFDTRLELDEQLRSRSIEAVRNGQSNDRAAEARAVDEQLRWTLLRVVQLLQWRAAIESDSAAPGAALLRMALRDKEQATLERAFWLMELRQPDERFALVWRGLQSDNARLQAASVEVLEAALTGPAREAVLAIIDESNPPGRRARVASVALGTTVRPISYREAVDAMIQEGHSPPP